MAITAPDLIHPKGRIHRDLFPERSEAELNEDVEGWIAEGLRFSQVASLEEEADQERAATAWAYHRAFDAACIAMAANPTSHAQTDAGSSQYAKDQRDTICQAAVVELARFNELAPRITSSERRTGGQTVRHQFAW